MKQLSHSQSKYNERQFPVVIFCDYITGEANGRSLFRLVDAFNIEKLVFTGEIIHFNTNRLKITSRSTHLHLAYETRENNLAGAKEFESGRIQPICPGNHFFQYSVKNLPQK